MSNDIDNMSHDELRIAIAKSKNWTDVGISPMFGVDGYAPGEPPRNTGCQFKNKITVPDYPGSWTEAGKLFEEAREKWDLWQYFCQNLDGDGVEWILLKLTPESICRAYLKAVDVCRKNKERHMCERCGGTGKQISGLWTGKEYNSVEGVCDDCKGSGCIGEIK